MTVSLKDRSFGVEDVLKILLYGPSGAGKTHLIGTFPGPVYVFDFDHKYKPLYGRDVELDSYNTEKESAVTEYERFRATLPLVSKDPKWKTIAIDGMSTLDPMVFQFLMKKSGRVMEYADIQTYGHHSDVWTWLVMQLNSPRCAKNVVLIGHDQYKVDDTSAVHRICPLIAGDKIQGKLPGLWEETYYYVPVTEGGKSVRRLYYQNKGKAVASSAVLSGKGYIDDPTYDTIRAEMTKCIEARKAGK